MSKLSKIEQISAVIRSNLVSYHLSPNEIKLIVEQTTTDILDLLENLEHKKEQYMALNKHE